MISNKNQIKFFHNLLVKSGLIILLLIIVEILLNKAQSISGVSLYATALYRIIALLILLSSLMYFFIYKPIRKYILELSKADVKNSEIEIDQQKKIEELKRSEEQYKKAFNSNPNPATITKVSDFIIIDANNAFLNLLEFTSGEVIGHTYPELNLYSSSTRQGLLNRFLKDRFVKSTEVDVKTKTGKILKMLVSGEIINFAGEDYMLVNFVDITRQKRIEEALKESEERFSKAFLNGPFGAIILTSDYRCIEVNNTFLELFGYEPEEVIGNTSVELNLFKNLDYLNEIRSLIDKEGSVRFKEFEMQTKTGEPLSVLISAQKLLIGNEYYFFSSYIDITARKKAEEELRRSEQRWITTLSSLNEAVIATDQEGKVTFFNSRAESLMGWSRDEVLDRPLTNFYHTINEVTREKSEDPFHKIQKHRVPYREMNHLLLIRKQGEEVPIEESGALIKDEDENVNGVVLIFHDVSEQKAFEKKLKEYNTTLEEKVKERTSDLVLAKEQAESADRLKTSFLLTMSHELRTPLNSIIGFSGILNKEMAGPLNSEQKKQISMIQKSGRHLLHLVNDILDMSKIEMGQLKVNFESFDVGASIEQVVDIEKSIAENKGISLKLNRPEEKIVAESDAARFQQVILNLVHNAVKFTDHGTVIVEFHVEQGNVYISVSDTGIGIKEEDISKLFVSFTQLHNDNLVRGHQGSGSGLGLAISKKIMDLLHGSINVKSVYGEGSTFTVTLPLSPK